MNNANLNSIESAGEQRSKRARVVIVGGGFGGLAAAKALKNAPVEVILIDRTNHHLFQPLLYQVATSVLSPSQISSPIRGILRKQKNTTVIMGEVTGADKAQHCVFANDADRERVSVPYDYLILATGVRHSYFGHDEFEQFAPGIKSLADAVGIRNKVLEAFERAEGEENPELHRDLLTFVLVGAGPTGVEIHLGHAVEKIDNEGVIVAGERIASKTVIWTAGVAPSPAGKWLGAETDRAGRVRVQRDLRVPGHPEIFVIGDTASLDQDGKPLPGVAQVAMQQGRYVGKLIRRHIAGKNSLRPFRYFDKGNMAVVGKGYAVLQSGKVKVHGLVAWCAWAFIHIMFLAQVGLRISVFLQWAWLFLTGQRGSRLIVNHHEFQSIPTPLPTAITIDRPAQPVSAMSVANK